MLPGHSGRGKLWALPEVFPTTVGYDAAFRVRRARISAAEETKTASASARTVRVLSKNQMGSFMAGEGPKRGTSK